MGVCGKVVSSSSREESKQRLCTRSSFQIPNVLRVPIYSALRSLIFLRALLQYQGLGWRERGGEREEGRARRGLGRAVQGLGGYGENLGFYPREVRGLEGCGQREGT